MPVEQGAVPDLPRLLNVPELRTEPPSPVDEEGEGRETALWPNVKQISSDATTRQLPNSSALATDTESESDYASAHPNVAREHGPGRLSVFSRRAASKSSSENERRTMTIETETVANVFTNSAHKIDHHARSLKTKPSTDTVRASHKPKKKQSRVAVVNANHVPTKSEIFAATITQAVNENEDTDSDETFVYESNPRSPKRLSPSPSISSMRSNAGGRHASVSRLETTPRYASGLYSNDERDRDKSLRTHAVSGKRSMKFNNPHEEDIQRRHVSHTVGAQQRRILGEESPFVRSPRHRPGLERRMTSPGSSGPNSPKLSRPASPRQAHNYGAVSGKRDRKVNPTSFRPWSLYEDEEEGGSSSERSPFLRKRSSRLQQRHRDHKRSSDVMSGMPFIMVIICLMLIVCIVTAAVLSTSQPLRDVKVVNITNVLVSKQELLFDLVVEAYNPNALAVTVKNLEISVFAQSPYVRDESHWSPQQTPAPGPTDKVSNPINSALDIAHPRPVHGKKFGGFWPPWSPGQNDSGGRAPPDEDEDSITLLLGRVYEFDSSLQFESRFFNRSVSTASGELRVVKPGSITDQGGIETWERVIQHSFELVIRGVMKYQSSQFTKTVRTAELYKTAHINPARLDGSDGILTPNSHND